jgi:hypothetical protein
MQPLSWPAGCLLEHRCGGAWVLWPHAMLSATRCNSHWLQAGRERVPLVCVWVGRADGAGGVSTRNAPQWRERSVCASLASTQPHSTALLYVRPMQASASTRDRKKLERDSSFPMQMHDVHAKTNKHAWPPKRAACGLSIRGEVASPCLALACVLSLDCMSVSLRAGFAASDSLHEECHRSTA